MRNAALFVLGVFFLAFAVGFVALLVRANTPHTNVDDTIIGGCLLLGAILLAPADMKGALDTLRSVLPWTRKDGPPDLHP